MIKLSQNIPSLTSPDLDIQGAIAYNTKSEQYFKPYEDEIKSILATTSVWTSPEFAQAVYKWQQENGIHGRLVDGKFGPITMAVVVKKDPSLAQKYDPYAAFKAAHQNEQPYKRVVGLLPEIERIKKEMGATEVPTEILLGWIQIESGGKLNDLTTSAGFREAGLFQISEDEAKALNVDQDRVLEDQDYAIKSGIRLAQYHANKLDTVLEQHPRMKQFLPKDGEAYWKMCMFSFSAGPGTMAKLIANMDASGQDFNNWSDILSFAAANPYGYRHSVTKWLFHNTRAWNLGSKAIGQKMAALVQNRIKTAKLKAQQLFN